LFTPCLSVLRTPRLHDALPIFTLCSSGEEQARDFLAAAPPDDSALPPALDLEFDGACEETPSAAAVQAEIDAFTAAAEGVSSQRSEEHTSELQLRFDLVCCVLL